MFACFQSWTKTCFDLFLQSLMIYLCDEEGDIYVLVKMAMHIIIDKSFFFQLYDK